MNINKIIICIMAFFMVIGAIDSCIHNKLGLGKQFKKGILSMGQLTLSMSGLMMLVPVIASFLTPLIVPIFNFLKADPSIFAGSILGIDMGGYQLACKMATNKSLGQFSGIILSSMMGSTLVYTLPIGLGIIDKKDTFLFAKGILCGIIPIPVGCFLGGIMMKMSLKTICLNLSPIFLLSILIILSLKYFPQLIINFFNFISKAIVLLSTITLVIGILREELGLSFFSKLGSLKNSIQVVANIAFTLSGSFCLLAVINKIFKKTLNKFGNIIKINSVSTSGLLASLANNIAMFEMTKEMDDKGKVVNFAFCVSGSFILGDHLGFTAVVAPNMLLPMIISKAVSSVLAVILALQATKKIS